MECNYWKMDKQLFSQARDFHGREDLEQAIMPSRYGLLAKRALDANCRDR